MVSCHPMKEPIFKKLIDVPASLNLRITNARGQKSANSYIIGILNQHVPMGCLGSPSNGSAAQSAAAPLEVEADPARAYYQRRAAEPKIPHRPFVGKFGSQAQFLARDEWDIQYGDEEAKAAALAGLEARKAAVEAEKVWLAEKTARANAKARGEEYVPPAAKDEPAPEPVEKDEEWA